MLKLRSALDRVKAALAVDDESQLAEAINALEAASHAMGEALYAEAEREPTEQERRRRALPHLGRAVPEDLEESFEYLLLRAGEDVARAKQTMIAAVIDRELGFASVSIDPADKMTPAEEAELIDERLRAGALRGQYTATGTCALAEIDERKDDAFVLTLDHEDGTSVVAEARFSIRNGEVVWGTLIEHDGEAAVFPVPRVN